MRSFYLKPFCFCLPLFNSKTANFLSIAFSFEMLSLLALSPSSLLQFPKLSQLYLIAFAYQRVQPNWLELLFFLLFQLNFFLRGKNWLKLLLKNLKFIESSWIIKSRKTHVTDLVFAGQDEHCFVVVFLVWIRFFSYSKQLFSENWSEFCGSLHVFGWWKKKIRFIRMSDVSETPANPFFFIRFHFFKKIKLATNNTELKWHSLYDINIVTVLNQMVTFGSFLVVLLSYGWVTCIWSILLFAIISLHMCLIL